MMMEAVHTSETSIYFDVTKRRCIQEGCYLHNRHRGNLKSHNSKYITVQTGYSVLIASLVAKACLILLCSRRPPYKKDGYIYLNKESQSVVLGGVMFIVLIIGPKVCGFKPGRGRWIFNGDTIP
jgi:hypothetical protein